MTLPLDTAPGPSPDAEAERHTEISRDFLWKARVELDKGDLLQASQKAWGAAAHAVKATAEKRRWFSEADWKLQRATEIITIELKDADIIRSYYTARHAHFNFYWHLYDAQGVGLAIDAAENLVAKLEPTLAPDYSPPYVDATTAAKIRSLEQPTSEPDRDRLENGRPPMEERPPAAAPAT